MLTLKRIVALASPLILFLLLVVNVSAATVTSGPSGANGLRVYAGPGKGEVTLEWSRVSLAGENYSIKYGTTQAANQYVANHIGYITTYTIGHLNPGTRYYFSLERFWTGDVSAGMSGLVSVTVPSSQVAVLGTAGPVGRNLLFAKPGPQKGQVTLSWKRFFASTENYSVVYGVLPGKYIYGAVNVQDATPADKINFVYTVGSLQSGKRYYFALIPQVSGQGIYTTSEVSVVAR